MDQQNVLAQTLAQLQGGAPGTPAPVDPYAGRLDQIAQQLAQLDGASGSSILTPEEAAQRQQRNANMAQVGMAAQLGGFNHLKAFGAQLAKQAMDDSEKKVTTQGEYDPMTGVQKLFPETIRENQRKRLETEQGRLTLQQAVAASRSNLQDSRFVQQQTLQDDRQAAQAARGTRGGGGGGTPKPVTLTPDWTPPEGYDLIPLRSKPTATTEKQAADAMGAAESVAQKWTELQNYHAAVKAKFFPGGWAGDITSFFKEHGGDPLVKNYLSTLNALELDAQLLQKGPQTDADARRIFKSLPDITLSTEGHRMMFMSHMAAAKRSHKMNEAFIRGYTLIPKGGIGASPVAPPGTPVDKTGKPIVTVPKTSKEMTDDELINAYPTK